VFEAKGGGKPPPFARSPHETQSLKQMSNPSGAVLAPEVLEPQTIYPPGTVFLDAEQPASARKLAEHLRHGRLVVLARGTANERLVDAGLAPSEERIATELRALSLWVRRQRVAELLDRPGLVRNKRWR
jgi:hypothetical protein